MSPLSLVPRANQLPFVLADALQDFLLSRRAALHSPRTIEFYEQQLGPFVGWLSDHGISHLTEVKAYNVRAYLAGLSRRGLKPSSVHCAARAVKTFLRFGEREGWLDRAPRFEMPQLGEERHPVVTAEELKRILAICRSPRDKTLVLVLADSGVRRAEAAGLTWGDVSIERGSLLIRAAKGGRQRDAFVGSTTRRALLRLRRVEPHGPGDSVFRLSVAGVSEVLRRCARRSGVGFSAHGLRRFYATSLLVNGADLLSVARLLGHRDLAMVQRYARLTDLDLERAAERHGPVDRLT